MNLISNDWNVSVTISCDSEVTFICRLTSRVLPLDHFVVSADG